MQQPSTSPSRVDLVVEWFWRQKVKLGILVGGFCLGLIEAYWADEKFAGPLANLVKGVIALLATGLIA